jgi:glycosyltransferase involved in cell wall biosynthesis
MSATAMTSSSHALSGTAVRRVGVDACPLGHHRTGVANYVWGLLEPLVQRYPQVQFFLYSNDPINFVAAPNVVQRSSAPVGGRKLRGPLWQNTQLVRMAAQDGLDAYWATNGMLPLWGLSGLTRVLTVHDLADVYAPATQQSLVRWNRRVFQRLSVWHATHTLAVSAATGADMQRHYGRGADGVIHPLPGARFVRPAPAECDRVRAELSLPARFWLSVGTLEPRKNLAALIRAHQACLARGVPLPQLVLAGGAGWLNTDIEATIAQGEAQGSVRRLGFVDGRDLPALYAACEVFLMPSLYEGFGMPILEAQLCGTPVVHGHHASMVEAGGGLGWSVAPDQASLEAALQALAQGLAPLCCRLPSDEQIQHQAQGVQTLAQALGLLPQR